MYGSFYAKEKNYSQVILILLYYISIIKIFIRVLQFYESHLEFELEKIFYVLYRYLFFSLGLLVCVRAIMWTFLFRTSL